MMCDTCETSSERLEIVLLCFLCLIRHLGFYVRFPHVRALHACAQAGEGGGR